MAILIGAGPGDILRSDVLKLRQRVRLDQVNGTARLQKWPRRRGKTKSERQQAWIDRFTCIARVSKSPDPRTLAAAQYWARVVNMGAASPMKGGGWFYRDVIAASMAGKGISFQEQVRVLTPTANATRLVAQSVPANTETVLVPSAIIWDNNQFWHPTINPGRLTFRSPGVYLVGATVERTSGGTSRQYNVIRKNANENISVAMGSNHAAPSWHELMGIGYFNANDWAVLSSYLLTGVSTWRVLSFWAMAITPEGVIG